MKLHVEGRLVGKDCAEIVIGKDKLMGNEHAALVQDFRCLENQLPAQRRGFKKKACRIVSKTTGGTDWAPFRPNP
jgi:hypothetical protein